MTDTKKKERSKSGAKGKKLKLNKETLRDLGASTDRARELKGGANRACTGGESGCEGG